jgi:hypothetical protein
MDVYVRAGKEAASTSPHTYKMIYLNKCKVLQEMLVIATFLKCHTDPKPRLEVVVKAKYMPMPGIENWTFS